jgi:hypothetical protein
MKLLNRLFCLVPMTQAVAGPAPGFPLAGTWTLIAADLIRPDGVRVRDYGEAPPARPDGAIPLSVWRRVR